MTKYVTEWKAVEFKEVIRAQLAANAPEVGVYVETDARRRLDAIRSPDNRRAVNYRRYLSRYMLTHVITVSEDEVEIAVGLKKAADQGGDYKGFYIETGSRTAPAHPFLRPAVFQNMRDILDILLR